MAYVSVRVTAPPNRDIYIDGTYLRPAGRSPDDTFAVSVGRHIFETLDTELRVDNRRKFDVPQSTEVVTITLEAVNPPEPTE